MKILKSIKSVRDFNKENKARNKIIAFVPTMGNLHEGHLSLVKKAKEKADIVIVSIFVNPLQFSPNEDLDSYPKTLKEDLEKLEELQVDAVFTPTDKDIYPEGKENAPRIYIKQFETMLCALSRPDFFSGIATVVAVLFNIVKPDIAIFGEKDFQQLLVIKKLVKDLHFDIEILSGELIREESGLAMSSRNNYFTKEQKGKAAMIYSELNLLKHHILQNNAKSLDLYFYINKTKSNLEQNGFITDYLEFRSEDNLDLITDYSKMKINNCRIFAAFKFHNVRLIDNIKLE